MPLPPNPVQLEIRAFEGQAVRQWVTQEGGALTGDLPGGGRFTLAIPAQALLSAESIGVVPIAEVAQLPGGDFIAGVRLEPEGLRLLLPATLSIDHTSDVAVLEEAAVRAAGPENELVLAPLLPSSRPAALPVFVFEETFVVRVSPAGIEELQAFPPSSVLDQYFHAAAGDFIKLRGQSLAAVGLGGLARPAFSAVSQQGDDTTVEALAAQAAAFRENLRRRIAQAMQSSDRDLIQSVVNDVLSFERFQQLLGIAADDESLWPEAVKLLEHLADVILTAIEQRCDTHFDLEAAREVLAVSRQLQLLGISRMDGDSEIDRRIEGLLARCLSLTLLFDSTIEDSPWVEAGHTYGYQVTATIPLRFEWALMGWTGRAPIEWVAAHALPYEGVSGDGGTTICQAAVIEDQQPSIAEVIRLTINLNDKPQPPEIQMAFSPGTPRHHIYHDCSNLSPSALHWRGPRWEYGFRYWSDLFLENYGYLGGDEVLVEGVAHVVAWRIVNEPGVFAVKEFSLAGDSAEWMPAPFLPVTMKRSESSTFRLVH